MTIRLDKAFAEDAWTYGSLEWYKHDRIGLLIA